MPPLRTVQPNGANRPDRAIVVQAERRVATPARADSEGISERRLPQLVGQPADFAVAVIDTLPGDTGVNHPILAIEDPNGRLFFSGEGKEGKHVAA